jgi:rhamnosyltransferase
VQDAVPADDRLLESIVREFDDAQVAGVYARQIPRPEADLLTKRNLTGWLTGRMEREERQMKSLAWYEALSPMEKYLFCNFDNVCSAVRKAVWDTHKFGRINFGEDIDWAERVLKSGHKLVYQPSAAVVHSHDRPISYEYKRTYVCHRKLYQQFQLRLVPSLKGIHRSWAYSTLTDVRYIAAQPAPLAEKVKLWTRTPVLNLFSAYAQYRAASDEAAGRDRHVRGV